MSLGEEVTEMYNTIIRKIDIINLVFSIVATVALLVNEHALFEAIIIIVATLTLVATKYRFNKLFIFVTYSFSILLLGIIFTNTAGQFLFENISILTNIYFVIAVAIIIGGIAAFTTLGTNALSMVWLVFHLFMFVSAIQMTNHVPFIKALWSSNAQLYTIREYYPFIIAGFLIGMFLEKYQKAIKHDRNND